MSGKGVSLAENPLRSGSGELACFYPAKWCFLRYNQCFTTKRAGSNRPFFLADHF
jgi:hypothetical protein